MAFVLCVQPLEFYDLRQVSYGLSNSDANNLVIVEAWFLGPPTQEKPIDMDVHFLYIQWHSIYKLSLHYFPSTADYSQYLM